MMIQNSECLKMYKEVEAGVSPPDSYGVALNRLLSCFFKGFPINFLEDLLCHSSQRVVVGGLFIAEELGQRASAISARIAACTQNDSDEVRYGAYEALPRCVSQDAVQDLVPLLGGLFDRSAKCRKVSTLGLISVNKEVFLPCLRAASEIGSGNTQDVAARLLAQEAIGVTAIESCLLSPDTNIQAVGLIIAGRTIINAEIFGSLIKCLQDEELKSIAGSRLKFLTLSSKRRKWDRES